jgi:hypothetical protein
MTIWMVRVQGLMPADFVDRENLCWCFVQRSPVHFFVPSVLFTRFGRDGIISVDNKHQWTEKNPRHQQQFSINVWVGIVGDCSIGWYGLSHRLIGNYYRDFLSRGVTKLQEDVPVAVRASSRSGTF